VVLDDTAVEKHWKSVAHMQRVSTTHFECQEGGRAHAGGGKRIHQPHAYTDTRIHACNARASTGNAPHCLDRLEAWTLDLP